MKRSLTNFLTRLLQFSLTILESLFAPHLSPLPSPGGRRVPRSEAEWGGAGGEGERQRLLKNPSFWLLFSLFFLFSCAPAGLLGPTISPAPAVTSPPPPTPSAGIEQATETPNEVPSLTPRSSPTENSPLGELGEVNPHDYTFQKIAAGLHKPVYLTHAGDGSGRLFIVEQPGRISIVQDGERRLDPFLDIRDLVNDESTEQGLLGLAFSPDYANNGQFFIHYSDENGDTTIMRYSVSSDPNRADPDSAQLVLQVDQPYANHNGGDLVFGPDGYLYIGLGDGGSQGDPQGNGQNLNALLGKMLRIDVSQEPYGIPPDNPFINRAGARPEVWAYGLRNPWRYSFDRETGDLYIADVGGNAYEEVNFQPASSHGGEDYGWNFLEGSHEFRGQAPDGLILPIAEYSHEEGGCSITGGYVYRGPSLPGLNGVYFFGDYCSGYIWGLMRTAEGDWAKLNLWNTSFNISSFGEDEAGELYVMDHGGEVQQIVSE
jgi:glucose/arabinose dehydrogenase